MGNPADISDPFSLLGLEPSFGLRRAEIESAYLRKVGQMHPDVSGIADSEGSHASSQLNRAKELLLDHESRANALLGLLGGPAASEQKTLPDGFLMNMMEIREQIQSDQGDIAKREEWELWAQNWRDSAIKRVQALFDERDTDENTRVKIRTELNAWRYIERLIEQLDPDYDPANADFE